MYKIFTQYRNMRVFKKIIKYYTKKYISETHKKGTLKILNDLFYLTLIKKTDHFTAFPTFSQDESRYLWYSSYKRCRDI